jgi:hypothetical protein
VGGVANISLYLPHSKIQVGVGTLCLSFSLPVRLVLEEFGPNLQHIKGERNVVADALSRLEIDDEQEIFNISECFGYDDDNLPTSSFPLRHEDIAKAQLDNPALLFKL